MTGLACHAHGYALAGRAGLREGRTAGRLRFEVGEGRAISTTSRRAITPRPEGKPGRVVQGGDAKIGRRL